MGQMVIVTSGDCLTVSLEWNDNNNRIANIHVSNNCGHDIAIQVHDSENVLLAEKTYASGQYTQNLPGSAQRYVELTEVGPDDFEIELFDCNVSVRSPA